MMHRLRRFLWLTMALLALNSAAAQYTGVTATSTPSLNVRRPLTTDRAILYPSQRDLTILSGDLVTVSVFGVTPTYVDIERVMLNGSVHLPLAGEVQLAGLTVSNAELRLSQFFEEKQLFHDAQVNVQITEAPNHVVTLTGMIERQIPIVGQKGLLDVLSLAGGLPTNASTVIQIDRPGLAEPILVDLGNDPAASTMANVPVFSGDIITTGSVGQFYVVGAVNGAGVHPLIGARPVTIIQALAASGGTTSVAKRKDARLVRTVGNTRSVIPLDIARIERGQDVDLALQADDILLVPTSAWKSIFKVNNLTSAVAIALSLTTLLNR